MRYNLLMLAGTFLISISIKAQETTLIDLKNPLNSTNHYFDNVNEFLVFEVIFNSNDELKKSINKEQLVDLMDNSSGSIRISATGTMVKTSKVETKVEIQAFRNSTNNKFKWEGEFRESGGAVVNKSTRWLFIKNLQLEIEINNTIIATELRTIYRPLKQPSKVDLSVRNARFTEKRVGKIEVRSQPQTRFQIAKLVLTDNQGQSKSYTTDNSGLMENEIVGINGVVNLTLNHNIDFVAGVYGVAIEGETLEDDPRPVLFNQKITFIDQLTIKITDDVGNPINIGDQDEYNIYLNTTGKGRVSIRFTPGDFSNKVTVNSKPTNEERTKWQITLRGLKDVNEKFAYFHYVDENNRQLSGPILISKYSPNVSEFIYIGLNEDDKIKMDIMFVEEPPTSEISVQIIPEGLNPIEISGSGVIDQDGNDKKLFHLTIPKAFTAQLKNQAAFKAAFNVKYNESTVYTLTLSVVDYEALESSIANATAQILKKEKDRNDDKLKEALEKILEIGEALGNSVDGDSADALIASLDPKAKNQAKIKGALSKIGGWASFVGKIVLPVI